MSHRAEIWAEIILKKEAFHKKSQYALNKEQYGDSQRLWVWSIHFSFLHSRLLYQNN